MAARTDQAAASSEDLPLVTETERAISQATWLTPADAGALAALRALARKIDAWDRIVEYAIEDLQGKPAGTRPAVPQNDNVSIASYLKYCEQLGLTPSGRKALGQKDDGDSSKSAKLTALRGGKQAAKRPARRAASGED